MGKPLAVFTAAFILLASLAPGSPAPAAGTRVAPFAPFAPWQAAMPAAASAAWTQFGFDSGHGGFDPTAHTIGAQNIGSLQIAWNDPIVQASGLVVDRGVAYVDDQDQSPGSAYALNVATGKQIWSTNVGLAGSWGSFLGAPAVAGDVLLSPCSNGSSTDFKTGLCGLNSKTGKVLWSQLCVSQGNGCGGLTNHGTSPTVYNKLAYFQMVNTPNEQPDILAVEPKTGRVVWDVPGVYHCPDGGLGSSHPLPAANGHVYGVLACQGPQGVTQVCAFSASSGATDWCATWPTGGVDTLVEGEGKVFASAPGDSGTSIIALDEQTGKIRWTSPSVSGGVSSIAVANGRVFVNNVRSLYALSATTGKPQWSQSQGNLVAGGAISVANGLVITDGGGGNNNNVALTALNEKTGAVVWSSTAGNGAAYATPVVLGNTIYAGCYTLCAFRLPQSRSL